MKELIQVSPEGKPRRAARVVAALAGVILAGTGVLEVTLPPSKAQLFGEEAERAEAAARNLAWRDGSRAEAIETEFGLRGRVRREVAPYWAALMLRLRDVPSRKLIVGSDGYLFYRERVELDPSTRERGMTILAHVCSAIRRCLRAHGSELIVAPIPRKSVAARAKLPQGVDPEEAVDRQVLDAFQRRGIPTLDLLPLWTEPGSSSYYLAHDSHWSTKGVESFAAELARQFPGLPRNTGTFELVEGPPMETIGSLAHAGVLPRHPAYDLVTTTIERSLFLEPAGREQRMTDREEPAEIYLAGSSFCEGFFAQARLAHTLQAPVASYSRRGRPPLYSLHAALTTTPVNELPRFAIAEFPIHQAAGLDAGSGTVLLAMTGILDHVEQEARLHALDEELFPWRLEEEVRLERPWIRYAGSSLLTSGDGVLRVRLSVKSEVPTRWRIAASGMALAFKIAAGENRRTIPVIEGERNDGVFWIAPIDENAAAAARDGHASVEILTEADWDRGRGLACAFSGEESEPDGWTFAGTAAVEPLDCLVVRWKGVDPTAALTVHLAGTRSSGEPFERSWPFPKCGGAKLLTLGLGALEGGFLEEIRLDGPLIGVESRIAPANVSK